MALLIAQFVVLMAATVAGRLVFVNPDPSNMLQQLLCNSSTDFNDTTLLLSTSGVHTMLPTGSLCLIQYASNLTITAEPLSDSPATIHCRSEPVNGIASSGFALVFGSGIRISNLVFRNCGEKVSTVETRSSSFDQSTRAALLIVDSKSVILSNVTIYSWYGYGLLCINIAGRSSFNYLIVTNGSNAKSQSRGSGVAIVYNQKLTADSTVQVTNSRFYGNQDHLDNALSDWPTFKFVPLNISNIPGAGGLTVLVQDVSTAMINVTVSNSIFTRNTGPIAGGAAVLVYNSSSVSCFCVLDFLLILNADCTEQLPVIPKQNRDELDEQCSHILVPIRICINAKLQYFLSRNMLKTLSIEKLIQSQKPKRQIGNDGF